MIENLKPFYNRTLRPAALLFSKAGLSPNHITIIGVILFAVSGYYCYVGKWYTALILVIAGSLMDGLDGVVARECGKISRFGAILDSCCDRITEIVLILGIMLFYAARAESGIWPVCLCFSSLSGSVMVSYVKARCEGAGVSCRRGIMQRPERLIIFCFGLLCGPEIMVWILAIVTFFTFVTVLQRLFEALAECKATDREKMGKEKISPEFDSKEV